MYDASIRIKRAENGYVVCMTDPEIMKKNRSDNGPYQDPEREYIMQTREEVAAFLTENMDKALADVDDGYGEAFAKMSKE